MESRYFIVFLILCFHLSCQSFIKEPENSLIDLQKSPDTLSLFGENVISTSLYERDMAISPQGDELVYTLGDYKQHKRCLVIVKKLNGNWGDPEVMAISGIYHDIEPFYTHDGSRLYFASNRPIYNDSTRNDYNIWYSDRVDDLWSAPVPLDSIINSTGDEFFPSLSQKGSLFFTSTRENGIGSEDIFVSKYINGKFSSPEPLPLEINTPSYEFNAFISPNEDLIIFSSFGRNDGFGGGDLYFSKKGQDGHWLAAKNMGERINSDKLDYCPFIDFNTGNFYFTSERVRVDKQRINTVHELQQVANRVDNGLGNIYRIGLKELEFTEKNKSN